MARLPSRSRLLLLAVCLLAPAASPAADLGPTPTPAPTPIPTLKLNDGRVLHNVQVRANQDTSIVVLATEGFLKIAKTNLPKEVADAYPSKQPPAQAAGQDMVMQPFNPNPPGAGAEGVPGAKPTPRPTRKPAFNPAVYKGCTIVSFQAKAWQTSLGCAEVVIRNDTDDPATISPGEIFCITTDGVRHPGRIIVTDGEPPTIKRQETVPARGSVDDIVTFSNDAMEISYVQWAR
jgi:hypothetical protein